MFYIGKKNNTTYFILVNFIYKFTNKKDTLNIFAILINFDELCAIYKNLLLVKDMNIDEFVCYSDSLQYVNLIKGPQVN
jgi:hypothetical protein